MLDDASVGEDSGTRGRILALARFAYVLEVAENSSKVRFINALAGLSDGGISMAIREASQMIVCSVSSIPEMKRNEHEEDLQ